MAFSRTILLMGTGISFGNNFPDGEIFCKGKKLNHRGLAFLICILKSVLSFN